MKRRRNRKNKDKHYKKKLKGYDMYRVVYKMPNGIMQSFDTHTEEGAFQFAQDILRKLRVSATIYKI